MPLQISDLIAQMTLEEKAALCTGETAWTTFGVERLGLESAFLSDGPHGLRRVAVVPSLMAEAIPATCFPVAAALSASWNVDLAHELGQAIAQEAIDTLVLNFPDHPALNKDGEFDTVYTKDGLQRSLINKLSLGLFNPPKPPQFDSRGR